MNGRPPLRHVAVYCGSSPGARDSYAEAAREMGRLLARRGLGLVYGGGRVGLMGVLADAVLEAGGLVRGVITEKLLQLELGHPGLTELVVLPTMAERKQRMASMADAFVALPGGIGTLEEIAEVATLSQLHYHDKPVGLLNVDGYYDPLLAWWRHAVTEGFVRPVHADLFCVATTPGPLLDALQAKHIPGLEEWLS